MALSAAERQRRSDLARQMHAEGRLGSRAVARKAAARSAEVRTRQAEHRASRIARDLFERHRDEVERALLDALKNGTRSQRIKAAETLTKLALSGERIDTSAAKAEHEDDGALHYDLACFAAGAGRLERALRHWRRAVALRPEVRGWAPKDPDLDPIRKSLGG